MKPQWHTTNDIYFCSWVRGLSGRFYWPGAALADGHLASAGWSAGAGWSRVASAVWTLLCSTWSAVLQRASLGLFSGGAVQERKQKYTSTFSGLHLHKACCRAVGQDKSHNPARHQWEARHRDRSNSRDTGRLLNAGINAISTALVFWMNVTGEGQS